MNVLIPIAFVSGIITVLSPCILPLLPIILANSATTHKARPWGMVVGFILSFSIFTLGLSTLLNNIGISPNFLRVLAVVIIAASGLIMVVPKLRDGFEIAVSRFMPKSKVSSPSKNEKSGALQGFGGGVTTGISLGLVWTPCVGPIMASVISLALTQNVDGGAVFITIAYSLGTAIPMTAILLGGQALWTKSPKLRRNMPTIQRVMGVLLMGTSLAIATGADIAIQTWLLDTIPNYAENLTALEDSDAVQDALTAREEAQYSNLDGSQLFRPLKDPDLNDLPEYSQAPEFVAQGPWINTEKGQALSMEGLEGKVVLVDFWTYTCINCVRTMPYLRQWHDLYGDDGLVIVGVHSPEFEFEKELSNVEGAIERFSIEYPVVLDNTFDQWQAYRNRYWPSHYFIDHRGTIRHAHFGEGAYELSERVIQTLLIDAAASRGETLVYNNTTVSSHDHNRGITPETYLGVRRAQSFVSSRDLTPGIVSYDRTTQLETNQWTLAGRWKAAPYYIEPSGFDTSSDQGPHSLHFQVNSQDVYLVIESVEGLETTSTIEVFIDGKPAPDTQDIKSGVMAIDGNRMYIIKQGSSVDESDLELRVNGPVRLFAFSFG